ncbi:solute carrier family 25 member 35-like [Tubulanus polymorphus]|uniref:solute carrier family 25 member 35-like n=1 Tax=Tubulanus polymorphus TaxID=672921 RepID=UPI003DA30103
MTDNRVEFVLGGIAACGAGFFTNPLEVVKTRMQLQGELQARGMYTVHYRNVFHAFYKIGRTDGILSLQSGLVPALWYQLFMNGVRLGAFQCFTNLGLTKDENGRPIWWKSVCAGALAGVLGASVGSPMYMLKTHLQSKATSMIAVGHQHEHTSMADGFRSIYRIRGVFGLWRGVEAAMLRVMVGSAAQLSTFSYAKHYIEDMQINSPGHILTAFYASCLSGVVVVVCMTPFDVMSTRIYNQGFDSNGKGVAYKNVFDCFAKICRTEGVWGFYKGWAPQFLRLAPHTVLSLVFWEKSRQMYYQYLPANS